MYIKGSLPNKDDFGKRFLTAGLKAVVKQESSLRVHAKVKMLIYLE